MLEDRINGERFESIPFDRRIALDTLTLHPELLHHAPGCRVAKKVPPLDAMESQDPEAEIDHLLARLGRVTTVPTVQRNPIPELGAAVLALDYQAYCADQGTCFLPDYRESGAAAGFPRWIVQPNPLGCPAVRIGVRDVEGGVGHLTRSGEALDVERVVGNERAERETLGVKRRLRVHQVRVYNSPHRMLSGRE
jgi:hypothetical protein